MVWADPSTPAAKIYADGKLSLRAPDGCVMAMADVFNDTTPTGYQAWMTRMATILQSTFQVDKMIMGYPS